MKVFISYSRQDEAVTHFLGYILERNGIRCLLDRKLSTGRKFDLELQEMIEQADLVLLLLTKASMASPWVNQEIGFALAHKKPIWPVALEKDIDTQGMISTTQTYSMFDWVNPSKSIDRLVKVLQKEIVDSDGPDYFKDFGFHQILQGKLECTYFIISSLRDLLKEKNKKIEILSQAAFSIFAVSNDSMYRRPGEHTDEYIQLLLQEQESFNELINKQNCTFKQILWPVRSYEPKYLAVRYQNLLEWMKRSKEDPSIQFTCAQYPGPNKIIINNQFCIEGFKLHHQSGYQLSVVKYETDEIDFAFREYEQTFARNYKGKDDAIGQIEAMYKKATDMWPSPDQW